MDVENFGILVCSFKHWDFLYKGFWLFRVYEKNVLLWEKGEISYKKKEGDWIIKLMDMY